MADEAGQKAAEDALNAAHVINRCWIRYLQNDRYNPTEFWAEFCQARNAFVIIETYLKTLPSKQTRDNDPEKVV